jgi:hypothetical protein
MALYPTLFGHVDLPTPEPLRRTDRHVAQEAGVRFVRHGESVRTGTFRSNRSAS